jgi:hypothetical protein
MLIGIALVGNPEFAIVDEAYPYIARRLLTDPSPRLREALRYMIYGRTSVFDAGGLFWGMFQYICLEATRGSAPHDLQQDRCVCVYAGGLFWGVFCFVLFGGCEGPCFA